VGVYEMRRKGLSAESCGAVSGVATRTVSPGNARVRFDSVASKASWGSETRLTRRPPVAVAAVFEERSIFV